MKPVETAAIPRTGARLADRAHGQRHGAGEEERDVSLQREVGLRRGREPKDRERHDDQHRLAPAQRAAKQWGAPGFVHR
jgi:hypothetical protein